MILFVHLIEGDDPLARLACIAIMAERSRKPPSIFAKTPGGLGTAPTDWFATPGCSCCLSDDHPRMELLRLARAGAGRALIDAGPPALCNNLLRLLETFPLPMTPIVTTARATNSARPSCRSAPDRG